MEEEVGGTDVGRRGGWDREIGSEPWGGWEIGV